MPTKEAKEDDAHDATQDTNEDHHALAKKKNLSSELMEFFQTRQIGEQGVLILPWKFGLINPFWSWNPGEV